MAGNYRRKGKFEKLQQYWTGLAISTNEITTNHRDYNIRKSNGNFYILWTCYQDLVEQLIVAVGWRIIGSNKSNGTLSLALRSCDKTSCMFIFTAKTPIDSVTIDDKCVQRSLFESASIHFVMTIFLHTQSEITLTTSARGIATAFTNIICNELVLL